MTIGFDHPYFWSAAALLAVLLLFYLRWRRSRRQTVAALFLWETPEMPPESGSRWQFHRLPLSFFLEALILLLLVLAGTAPFRMRAEACPPLAVILDDSFSMQAAGLDGVSPRSAGLERVKKELNRFPGRRVIWVLAGTKARLAADDREPVRFEDFWRCREPAADLAGAIALALSRSPEAEILAVTDRLPDFELGSEVGYFAAGRALDNLALVNVRRLEGRILLEAVNYGRQSRKAQVRLTPGGDGDVVTLEPGGRRKLVFALPPELEREGVTITLAAEGDPLPFDNELTVFSEYREPLAVRVMPELPEAARRDLESVFQNNPDLVQKPEFELLIGGDALPVGRFHRLFWHTGTPGQATLTAEPVSVVSGQEPVRGLSAQDLRWPADPAARLPGQALIRRGTASLLTFQHRLDGFYDFHLNLDPVGANLVRRPFWPVLFWNLADVLRRERSGPERRNYRIGEMVRLKVFDPAVGALLVTVPDGGETELPLIRRQVFLGDLVAGTYRIAPLESDRQSAGWSIAVSALNGRESDLSGAGSGEKKAVVVPGGELPRQPLGFSALLAALGVLMFHQYKLALRRRSP